MHRRRLIAIALGIGCAFGVFDWYVPSLFQVQQMPIVANLIVIYGIWLLPAFSIVFFGIRQQLGAKTIALLVSLTWATAIIVYYSYYAALAALPGLPQLDELRLINRHAPQFAASWSFFLGATLLPQIGKWLPVALVGGGIVGYAATKAALSLRSQMRHA